MTAPATVAREGLPELAAVSWRAPMDSERLRHRGRLWTLTSLSHFVIFTVTGAVVAALNPLFIPVALILLAHGLAIPELYASRGAGVLRERPGADEAAERVAAGLLGDLVGHEARELFARTGYVHEHGRLGTWLLGQRGAVLVAAGGRRAFCMCVRATGGGLPSADRVAHLLLALRSDEVGFATVANLAFSGSVRRLRRRLRGAARDALDAAVVAECRRCF